MREDGRAVTYRRVSGTWLAWSIEWEGVQLLDPEAPLVPAPEGIADALNTAVGVLLQP